MIYRLGRNVVLEAAAAEDVRAEQDFVEKLLLLLEHVIEHFKGKPGGAADDGKELLLVADP